MEWRPGLCRVGWSGGRRRGDWRPWARSNPRTYRASGDANHGIACWSRQRLRQRKFLRPPRLFAWRRRPFRETESRPPSRHRRRRLGQALPYREPPFPSPKIRSSSREGHQPPRGRDDAGVPGLTGRIPLPLARSPREQISCDDGRDRPDRHRRRPQQCHDHLITDDAIAWRNQVPTDIHLVQQSQSAKRGQRRQVASDECPDNAPGHPLREIGVLQCDPFGDRPNVSRRRRVEADLFHRIQRHRVSRQARPSRQACHLRSRRW